MSPLEIGILIGAIALVVFTVVWNVVRKLRGKSSCGCDTGDKSKKCAGVCSHCGADCPFRNR